MVARPAFLTTCGLVALGAVCRPAGAQTLAEADRHFARGDTAGAVSVLEALIRDDLRNAEAHYRLGLLYRSRIRRDASVDENRRKAEEHFRYATRFESDSAKYFVALADLFRQGSNSFTRAQIPGLLERARAAAARVGESELLTVTEYRAGRAEWERYEHYGRRFLPNDFAGPLRAGLSSYLFFAEWQYVEQFFATRSRPGSTEWGAEYHIKAEGHLRGAVDADPRNVDAVGLLVVLMAEHERWPEAVAVTRSLVRAVPDSGRAWALYGLALTRERRWREAEAAFDTGLELMTPDDRQPYLNLGQIMRRADQADWRRLPPDGRATLDTTYWAAAQPLALTASNELRTEFFARITYVEHRWSDPVVGYRGADTDIGAVYVRYGPPDIWAVFDRQQIAWVYVRSRLRFLFHLTPGFSRARFADWSREAARAAAEQSPARFDNVPVYRTLDTVLVQAVQFRGDAPRMTSVGLYSAIPVRRMVDSTRVNDLGLETGVILWDPAGRELAREKRETVLRDVPDRDIRTESWYLSLAPREYLLRVEAHLPVIDRAARSASTLTVRRYDARDRLMLSDVLAADHVAPRAEGFRRWTDFFIEPNAGRFLPNAPLALLWEIYNLATDSLETARFSVDVRITVEAIERRNWFAHVLGGIGDAIGVTAVGDDEVTLSYDQAVEPDSTGTWAEHLTIDLRDAPQGTYTITVSVVDLLTGGAASSARAIWVSERTAERPSPWER